MVEKPVHNHGSEEGAGLSCNELRLPDGSLRGACMGEELTRIDVAETARHFALQLKTYKKSPHVWGECFEEWKSFRDGLEPSLKSVAIKAFYREFRPWIIRKLFRRSL